MRKNTYIPGVWLMAFFFLSSIPAYAAKPTIAVPRFTIWKIEHKGKETQHSYVTASPSGVSEYRLTEIENREDVLKEIELPALTDIFVRHLVESGKFSVVERAKVDKILGEIEMGEKGLIDKQKIINKGKLLGADYLAIASLIYADAGVGYKPVPYTERFFRIEKGIIKVDIRVMKTSTGEIITAQLGEGIIENKVMVPSRRFLPLSTSFYHDLQEALAQDLATKVVDAFYPFSVVLVKEKTITANRGKNFNITTGDVYDIIRRGESIKDPDTGEILGYDEEKVGAAKIIDVRQKLCSAEVIEGSGIVVGDILRPVKD